MTWTGQTFSVGQVLTAAQMNNLQADITAAFNKDSGAPVLANNYVVTAMINSAAVTQSRLATSTNSQSGTVTADGSVQISFDAYSFLPDIESDGQQSASGASEIDVRAVFNNTPSASADSPQWSLFNPTKNVEAYSVAWRRITA